MADLASAIVRSSRAYAQPIAAAYASGNRHFLVELRRPSGGKPFYDRDTGLLVNPEDPLLYRGPARIHLGGPDVEIEVVDEGTSMLSTVISIDPTDSEDRAPSPRADDSVTIIDNADSQAAHLAGRVFEVTGVERGGHFDIGWRLHVLGAMPSRQND